MDAFVPESWKFIVLVGNFLLKNFQLYWHNTTSMSLLNLQKKNKANMYHILWAENEFFFS